MQHQPLSDEILADRRGAIGETPLIGVPICVENARWRAWERPALVQMTGYSDHLRRAGAIPVLLPAGGDAAEAAAVVSRLDGLVLPGGVDVDPALYQQPRHPSAGPFDTERDAWEIALVQAALDQAVPFFGICRGMQILNVALGGTLIQHLPDAVGHQDHNPVPGQFAHHAVRVAPDSDLGRALGTDLDVPTYHHQAVDRIPEELLPIAWAADGVIEAVTHATSPAFAVQWHPEADENNEIFKHFVQTCLGSKPNRAMLSRPLLSVATELENTR